ncbi:MAG: ABC transporter substrate binding protein [bacterium]
MKKLYIILIIALLSFTSIIASVDEPIFILNSYHPEFRWTVFEVNGIRNALKVNKYSGNIYIEYLDAKNFSYSQTAPMTYDLIKKKYKGFNFKMVVCTDNDAYNFVQMYGKELFPEADFVFCGLNGFTDSMITNREKFAGVFETIDYEANIAVILKIFPDTKEIVSFYDCTISGIKVFEEYKRSTEKFKNSGVKFTNIINPTINELITELAKLKKGQVVFQGELGKDKNGTVYNHFAVTKLITGVCKVPVFGAVNDMLRKGIIGGKLINAFDNGRAAGNLVIKILNGKSPKDLPIVKNLFGKYFFDFEQLTKFGVDKNLLHPKATIINKPITMWEKNRALMLRIGVIFFFLVALILYLIFNIIGRRKAEKLSTESKSKLDKVLSSIAECIWSIDIDSSKNVLSSYFSPVFEKIYGYPQEYFSSNKTRWEEFIIQEDRPILEKAYKNLTENISNNELIVFRIKSGTGNIKWIEQNISITRSEKGTVRFDGITKDITYSREQEEIFLRFLKAIERSPISVMITNTDGLIEYVNPYFEKTSGYGFDEIKNKNPRFLKTEYYKKEDYQKLWEIIKSGKEWKGEFLNRRKNGENYWELATITSIKNDNGVITHYLSVKEDITHLKEVEIELIRAKENAEKANRLKDEFLAQMSHEIRTPINAILSFAGLLKDELIDKIDDDLKISFAVMERAGKRIIRTIDLVLNMAEMKTGYFQPTFEEIDVNTRIAEVIQYDFKQTAKDKNLYLNFTYHSLSNYVIADEYTFDEIIKNLIDNALKYTFLAVLK